jgi:hypothetical protein
MGLRLYQQGEKLSLRGTLAPLRPSSTTAGIEFVEAEAYRLGALLA